jgi:hypothetical protein
MKSTPFGGTVVDTSDLFAYAMNFAGVIAVVQHPNEVYDHMHRYFGAYFPKDFLGPLCCGWKELFSQFSKRVSPC